MSKYIIDRVTRNSRYIISDGGDGTKFGLRDIPELGMYNNYHIGNDYNTPEGTPLYAPVDCKVIAATLDKNADYGLNIFLFMPQYNKTLHLAHLKSIAVQNGSNLLEGTYIGESGNTGKSTAPHLHLGIAKGYKQDVRKGSIGDGTWENPSKFFVEKKPELLSLNMIAKEVINRPDRWKTGQARKDLLKRAGYDADAVQREINRIINGEQSVNAIAKDVINRPHVWKTGQERKTLLKNAGYDADAVQREINRILA